MIAEVIKYCDKGDKICDKSDKRKVIKVTKWKVPDYTVLLSRSTEIQLLIDFFICYY